jgi:hypothetical protein
MSLLHPALTRCRGFTVIELAAILAVTALVVALGYSAHRTHLVRAQIAAGIAAAKPVQDGVQQAFRKHGEPPARVNVDQAASALVESFTVVDGRIDILYGNRADPVIAGRHLSLTPYETATLAVTWTCGNAIPGAGVQPLGFAGGGRQAVQIATTVEARWLPRECR